MDVSATPSILSTNVQWKFDGEVEKQITGFRIEVSSDMVCRESTIKPPPSARTATLSDLESGITYDVKLVAVYNDGTKAASKRVSFTTPGNLSILCSILRNIII